MSYYMVAYETIGGDSLFNCQLIPLVGCINAPIDREAIYAFYREACDGDDQAKAAFSRSAMMDSLKAELTGVWIVDETCKKAIDALYEVNRSVGDSAAYALNNGAKNICKNLAKRSVYLA